MPLHRKVRLLKNKWEGNNGWPKRLEWIEIQGIRGWTGERIDFKFPLVAICGENGSGKSTILQAAASAYAPESNDPRPGWFASDFFPDTAWDSIRNASIRVSVREGNTSHLTSVRKLTDRWRGNPSRRRRAVVNVDLRRIQPIAARVGYARLAKVGVSEVSAETFDADMVTRLSDIMGRNYSSARMALTSADRKRRISVLTPSGGSSHSSFHHGAGELTIAELLKIDPPKYSLVLIDEVETSLHPRAQRRMLRDLADLCRDRDVQVILTTHSPYILSELPPEARGYILADGGRKRVVAGVSPAFAMTMMDEEPHPECDLYVEDDKAKILLREIMAVHRRELVSRTAIIPFGAANVGQALGQMIHRFSRPSLVFLDGDQTASSGCHVLPGNDAPEQVVFEALQAKNWGHLADRTGRPHSEVADACNRATTADDHHEWVTLAATRLVLSGDALWQAMCAEWASTCLAQQDAALIVDSIALKLG